MRERKKTVRLDEKNFDDIICCPGGAELKRNDLKGPLENTVDWRENMIEKGMKGIIEYEEGEAVGFVEYMPAEDVPLPIIAPGAAVLMCFHWVKPSMSEEEHLNSERELVKKAVEMTSDAFTGMAALAWDHPIHFPISMMKGLGFKEIEKDAHLSLMWYEHEDENVESPEMIETEFEPRDLSSEGKLAIDQAYSNRCPFSIHNFMKYEKWIQEIDDTRIEHEIYNIDTREEALKYSVSPWGWEWLFLNGRRIETFRLEKEDMIESVKRELERTE